MSEINRVAHFVKKLSPNPVDALDRSDDCCKDDCKHDCKHDDCCKDDCKHDDCCKNDDCCPTRGIGYTDILLSLKDIQR
ncbi:hypothetical protein SDC9_63012 [bioreactor metagenome]|uniref:Uncharacterized protein n=1 Tax=bioreactor metagenome TaxID=1076179 RepID=A0A644XLC6_9ZZZZ